VILFAIPGVASVKHLVGGLAGFAIASAASIVPTPAPSIGPALVVILGYELPLLPALLGTIGVIATRRFAPIAAVETRIDVTGRHALTLMMVLAMLGLILSGERRPLVIVGIAGGLGYSGVAIFELLAAGVLRAARLAITVVSRGALSVIQDKSPEEGE
jgi:hypothetical protein